MTEEYTSENIEALGDLQAIRLRPGMYIGSTNNPKQLLVEALDNALDEVQSGFSDKAVVKIDTKNHLYSVRDYGRGIPIGKSSYTDPMSGETHQIETLQLVYQKTHSGGKFGDNDAYKKSRGMHGVGLKCINALSEYTKAITIRDNKEVDLLMSKGEINDLLYKKNKNKKNGTYVEFIPDKEIFDSLDITKQDLEEIIGIPKSFGLNIELYIDNEKIDLPYTNLYDLLPLDNSNILWKDHFYYENKETTESIELALVYTSETNTIYRGYTNMIYNPSGGSHIRYFEDIYRQVWEKYITDKFRINDIFVGLRAVIGVSISNKEMAFSSQTKERLTTSKKYFSQFDNIVKVLQDYFDKEESLRKGLIKRFEAYRASQNKLLATKQLSDMIYVNDENSTKTGRVRRKSVVEKLVECTNKKREGTSLIIMEGNSACGTLMKARDIENHALLPIRGKILNVSKVKNYVKCMKNEEVKSIVNASGVGLGTDSDYNKSRYENYWIMTDSDEDGKNIACLLISIFVNLLPDIVRAGKLFIVEAPLYGWIDKGKKYYTNDLSEVTDLKTMTRYKGLGEMDAEDMKLACLNPKNQHLLQIEYPDNLDEFNESMTSSSKRFNHLKDQGLIQWT